MQSAGSVQIRLSYEDQSRPALTFKQQTVSLLTGASGCGKTTVAIGNLAGTVARRMRILQAISGQQPYNPTTFQSLFSTCEVSRTPPLVLLDDLPQIQNNETTIGLLSKALKLEHALLPNACPKCSQPLINSQIATLTAAGLVKYFTDQPCRIATLSNSGVQAGISHILLAGKELSVDDPDNPISADLFSNPVYQVIDRFILNPENEVRLAHLLGSADTIQLLLGRQLVDLAATTPLLCLACLRSFSSDQVEQSLSFEAWLNSPITGDLLIDKTVLKKVSELVSRMCLSELNLSTPLIELPQPEYLRVLYLTELLAGYSSRLIVIDSPWLPGFRDNQLAEVYLLEQLMNSNNTIVACSTRGEHFPKKFIRYPLAEQGLHSLRKLSLDNIVVTHEFLTFSKLLPETETALKTRFACKRLILANLQASSRLKTSQVISFPDILDQLAELYILLPRSRELGLSAKSVRQHLRRITLLPNSDQLVFNGVSLADVAKLSVDQALQKFIYIPKLAKALKLLAGIGLDRVQLDRQLTNLSHGELRRYLLARIVYKSPRASLILVEYPELYLSEGQTQQFVMALEQQLEIATSKILCITDSLCGF